MNQYIIGLSGHIDHGKTSIVERLTGKNTDNLKEEIGKGEKRVKQVEDELEKLEGSKTNEGGEKGDKKKGKKGRSAPQGQAALA